jgi:hypothetical protein
MALRTRTCDHAADWFASVVAVVNDSSSASTSRSVSVLSRVAGHAALVSNACLHTAATSLRRKKRRHATLRYAMNLSAASFDTLPSCCDACNERRLVDANQLAKRAANGLFLHVVHALVHAGQHQLHEHRGEVRADLRASPHDNWARHACRVVPQ